jgi:hypothetical protein
VFVLEIGGDWRELGSGVEVVVFDYTDYVLRIMKGFWSVIHEMAPAAFGLIFRVRTGLNWFWEACFAVSVGAVDVFSSYAMFWVR